MSILIPILSLCLSFCLSLFLSLSLFLISTWLALITKSLKSFACVHTYLVCVFCLSVCLSVNVCQSICLSLVSLAFSVDMHTTPPQNSWTGLSSIPPSGLFLFWKRHPSRPVLTRTVQNFRKSRVSTHTPTGNKQSKFKIRSKFVFIQPLWHVQMVTQGQFPSVEKLVWVFRLTERLLNQDKKTLSALQFSYSWVTGENRYFPAFSKSISTKESA